MRRDGAGTTTLIRPIGFARGGSALGIAWLIACAIALLTGASAVVILLAVGFVAFLASLLGGRSALRRVRVLSVTSADLTDEGADLTWQVNCTGTQRVHAELRVGTTTVAAGWIEPGSTSTLSGRAPQRGIHTSVEARCSSAGRLGLVWWRHSAIIEMDTLAVAPIAADVGAPYVRRTGEQPDDAAPSTLAGRDEVDGIRQWRDGDELTAVHWPSTLRSGELVVRHRRRDVDERWVVQASTHSDDADREAARVRHSLERGLAAGARVAVQVDGHDAVPIADREAVQRWCAAFPRNPDPGRRVAWWRRKLALPVPEPEKALTPAARWAVAVATVPPLVMMLEPLGYGAGQIAVVVGIIAAGAFFSMRGPDHRPTLRQVVGLLAGLGVAVALIDVSAIDSVASSLRFALPQVLVTLVVMQGFECIDRRAARVSLACSAMLATYAAGIRVDDRLAAWLTAALLGLAIGAQAITRVDRRRVVTAVVPGQRVRVRGAVGRGVAFAGAGLAVLAVLAVVPVPRGPAQLTLPSWLEEYRPTAADGELATADGSPLLGNATVVTQRSGSGTGSGGYPGFSPTMDTSLRGELGDEVVLRVRAPYADFWRGQTFTRFDGRVWTVDAAEGERTEGPDHQIDPAVGDADTGWGEQFIQTFYAEVDLPNIVFAASRAERVLLGAPLWARPDGALRAGVVLPAGSAYTVVSQRSGATADGLRGEGDPSLFGSPPEFVNVPGTTSDRTRALAQQLAASAASTYDVIIAIEAWLHDHVTYNLSAPVPPDGADAVDYFLFESQQGFCEQIATATAIMLRTLGVPARIATGYVPSERDEVAGVWLSRASDAHAWVEVRFPNFGWVAFDPTASVPFAGEAQRTTIGGDLGRAIASGIGDHLAVVIAALVSVVTLLLASRTLRSWWRRRRRGRWGVLQDRFVAAALRRGASLTAPNAELAHVFEEPGADELAAALDACAFSASWADDDVSYRQAIASLQELETSA